MAPLLQRLVLVLFVSESPLQALAFLSADYRFNPVARPGSLHNAPPGRRVHMMALSASGALELPPDDVVQAVQRAGPKVTASDVASTGGIPLKKAQQGLVALAAVLGAETRLEVSRTGELVYTFPDDVNSELSKASQAASLRQAWEVAKPAVFTAARTAFGLALFASILVVYSALIILSTSSSSSERDRDRRDDSGGFGGGGFGGGFGFGPSLWYGPSPFDLFFYRPYYEYGGYYGQESNPRMGFLEAVYSFVFGDGDPNTNREQEQLAAVAATARKNGGVLTAEQLAPLLDPPRYKSASDSYNVDESWVLSTLTKLNGQPEVTPGGQIVYVFRELQATATEVSRGKKPASILEERTVPFSLADDGQLFLAGLLGAANLVGAGYLGVKLASLPVGMALPGFLGAVQAFYPALLAYALGFLAAPAVRYYRNGTENNEIEARNDIRREWRQALTSGTADGKLAEARRFQTRLRQVGAGDSVYDTAESAAKQGIANDMADFDKRLGGV